ncbi:protein S100-A11-like [Brachionichthys hirsutus]|uniref:protein S100-A11-like n=1 Tax=Brachionichthys hirsutus TaxID=412623 RepID=UPI00360438D4
MESAIKVLVSQFKAYAGMDGSCDTLSKAEFHRLVKSELPTFVENAGVPAATDLLLSSCDKNKDGELNFLEFWQLIGQLACKQGGFSQ